MAPRESEVTVIFDGDCGFCTSCASYVVKRSQVPVVALAWQLTDVSKFGLTKDQTAARVYVIAKSHPFASHRAIARLLIVQRNPLLRAVGHVMDVPPLSWLGALGYRLIARFRHRLPGGTPACSVARE